MRTICSFAAIAATVALAACNTDSPTAPSPLRTSPLFAQTSRCNSVSGDIDETGSWWPEQPAGTISGSFTGTTSGSLAVVSTVKTDAMWEGTRTFALADGDVYLTESLVLKTAPRNAYLVNSTLTIVGGTGIFAFSTGTLKLDGKFVYAGPPQNGGVHLKYSGSICDVGA